MKAFITEAQRLQKLAGITEAKVVPQRMPRRPKGQISEEEWKSIGTGFTTDEIVTNLDTDESYTIFETPQGFRFDNTPYFIRGGEALSCEIQYADYDPDPNIEEWIEGQVNELEQQLNRAGYKLEREYHDDDDSIILYIPI